MFSGIVKEVGKLVDKKITNKVTLVIEKPKTFEISLGDSISCNGVCLTVSDITENSFYADVMDETIAKTNLGDIEVGDLINIEPASRVGDKLDGHIVQGHVDSTAKIIKVAPDSNGKIIGFEYSEKFYELIVEKGSVCVNGISLTVINERKKYFEVSLVDFTLKNTNANNWKVGALVNIEFDILGKYAAKILGKNQ